MLDFPAITAIEDNIVFRGFCETTISVGPYTSPQVRDPPLGEESTEVFRQ